MNDMVFGVRLTANSSSLVSETRSARDEFVALKKETESLNAASSRMASQYSGLNQVVQQHSTEVKDTEANVRKLLDRYDPLGAKLRQLQADFKALDAAAASGKIAGRDDARVDAVYVRLQQQIAAATTATSAFGDASKATALSAGQLRMATQQLPMQFTDIFTSLAAGQNPMMVMLQQGGQLKDSFGGVGNAAQAMGGYVVGLVNPLTLAASAAVAGGAAWYYWGREAESAADRAVAAADKIISGMRATDAVYVLQRERDKLSRQIPMQWLSYDEKQLAKLDEDSQKLVAAYGKIDKQLKSETERSSREWEGLHATDAERKATALKQEKKVYDEQVALAKGNSDKLIALETQHQQKIAAINTEFDKNKKKTPRTEADQIRQQEQQALLSLQKQAAGYQQLSEVEQMRWEIENGNYRKFSEQAKQKLMLEAQLADAKNAEVRASKESSAAWDESAKVIEKARTVSAEYVNQLEFENSLLGLSTLEVQKRTDARRIDLALEKELLALRTSDKFKTRDTNPEVNAAYQAAVNGAKDAAEAAKAGAASEIDARDRVTRSWEFGSKEAIRKYIEEVDNAAVQTEALFAKGFKGAEDAVTQFMMTGKADIRSFANAVIEEFMRINVARPMVSAGADFLGSIVGSLFGDSPSASSAASVSQYSLSSGSSSFGLSVGPGRAGGGEVYPNTLHPVNENGPELLNYGGNDYLMMGGRGGYVKPLSGQAQAIGSGGGVNLQVNVINNANAQVRTQERRDGNGGMTMDVIIEQIEGGLARNVQRGSGALSSAMESTYGLNRASGSFR